MGDEVKVNNEIEQMLTALGNPTPENLKVDEEEDDKKDESSEDKKEEENKEEDSGEGEKKEKPSEEAPEEKKEDEKEEEQEEETDKDKIIENLRQRLNEKSETPEKKETQEEIERKKADEAARLKAEEAKKPEPLKLDEQDFIGDLDLDDLTRDKAALNKILNTVYAKGVNDSKRIATEGVLNTIPEIVKHNLTLLTTLKEASDNFYKENADLAPFKRVVAAVFEEIAAKNPDKKYSELMNLTAPEARKRLELHKQAVKNSTEENKGKPPRLPGAKSGQRQTPSQKPNTSAIENEISEMNKTLRR
jgi:hypothetical protein